MEFISIVIYSSIYIGLIATVFYVLSYFSDKKTKKPLFSDDELPKVSIIIPAYNEEKSIKKTLDSILAVDYPDFEVIVVDDGSKDDTLNLARKFESDKVNVFHKENGGKGTALNFGLEKANGEIVVSMDADTFVDPHSMKRMVRFFKDPKVMSVTPAMIIHKPKSVLQRIQSIEYMFGLFLRKTFAALDAIYIAPGAFTAYRKTFFDKYGGYDVGNITEDLELALRIQYRGYRTENCPEAPVYTEAPGRFKSLMLQRRRWYYGLIKNTLNYKKMFGRKYGDLGLFVMPISWISIFFAVFVTCYLFIKVLLDVKSEIIFLQSFNFDLSNYLDFNIYFIERALFLFFSNPVVLFILLFMAILGFYLYYASKKIGNIGGWGFNWILFFLFFAVLFGFWWVVSIFYAVFFKSIKWR